MIRPGNLLRIAREGFKDMGPALRQAFNERRDDDHLDRVFGQRPRLTIVGLTVIAMVVGGWLESSVQIVWPLDQVAWPAIFCAVALALPIRRYLFRLGQASIDDFPWIAACVIPGVAIATVVSLVIGLADIDSVLIEDSPVFTRIFSIGVIAAQALAVGAALGLAYAALCYSRNWLNALWELLWLLFILKLTLWFFEEILLEIGILDAILSEILYVTLSIRLPDWLGDMADQISFGLLVLSLYLAMLGATWTVCRKTFPTLLKTGEVDIIKTVRRMLDPPDEAKEARKAEKKAKAERKKAEKQAKKAMRK
ncbi:MAG: hypothetical protein AAGA84_00195 [Pseudomonadota bacterium]